MPVSVDCLALSVLASNKLSFASRCIKKQITFSAPNRFHNLGAFSAIGRHSFSYTNMKIISNPAIAVKQRVPDMVKGNDL